MTHLTDGVGQVIVFFEEIKSAESQQLKTDTHMAMIVEPVKHLDTQTKNREIEKRIQHLVKLLIECSLVYLKVSFHLDAHMLYFKNCICNCSKHAIFFKF